MRKPSAAKAQVIDFLKSTKLGAEYTFEFEGTEAEARSFVHNMRVHLSRMRGVVRGAGETVMPFRMELVSIVEAQNKDKTKGFTLPPSKQQVTLRKSNYDTEMHKDIEKIFDQLTI